MKGMAILLAMTIAGAGTGIETEIAVETETEAEVSYSDDDLWYMSHTVQAEAGYCEREMQEGVASVIMNRVNSGLFPNTVQEVILQPGQYSTASYLSTQEPTEQVIDVCIDILENGSKYPETVLYQANFVQGSGVYKSLSTSYSTMYFCYQ